MRFCSECENLLLPHMKKLYCRTCNTEFELIQNDFDEYKVKKTIKNKHIELYPVIYSEFPGIVNISSQYRKAYEEFFICNY